METFAIQNIDRQGADESQIFRDCWLEPPLQKYPMAGRSGLASYSSSRVAPSRPEAKQQKKPRNPRPLCAKLCRCDVGRRRCRFVGCAVGFRRWRGRPASAQAAYQDRAVLNPYRVCKTFTDQELQGLPGGLRRWQVPAGLVPAPSRPLQCGVREGLRAPV